jgi:hypothetical protein
MKVHFSGKTLEIDGRPIETRWEIRDAFEVGGKVIALLDFFANIKQPVLHIDEIRGLPKGQNLHCFSGEGTLLWEAEFPEGDGPDYYYSVTSHVPLVANSFSSYRCEIDLDTGRIVRRQFYK